MSNQTFDNNFKYNVEFNHDTVYSCLESGCYEEGICRCCSIENAEVTSVDINKLTDFLYGSVVDYASASGRRNIKLNSIFYGGALVDKYCINRILTHHKVYNTQHFEVLIEKGYYGDEIGEIQLNQKVLDIVIDDIEKIMNFDNLSDKIKYVLNLEYGYLLDNIEDMKFEVIQISKNEIDFKSLNQKHIQNTQKKLKDFELTFYDNKNYSLPRGVVRKSGNLYKIVDGYHRIISHQSDSKFDVFCLTK